MDCPSDKRRRVHLVCMVIFPNLWILGGIFHYLSLSVDRTICKQTVKIMMRRRIMRRLIWVCTFCICPVIPKRTLYLYGLSNDKYTSTTINK